MGKEEMRENGNMGKREDKKYSIRIIHFVLRTSYFCFAYAKQTHCSLFIVFRHSQAHDLGNPDYIGEQGIHL